VLQLIRNNSPFTVLILFIFTLIIRLPALLHPQLPVTAGDTILFNWLLGGLSYVFGSAAFAWTFFAVVCSFLQGLYLNAITIRHRLFARPTYVPLFSYLVLTSIIPGYSYFSAPLMVCWCLLLSFDVMLQFSQSGQPRKHIFNAGFMLSMAALLQFSAIFYFLLFIVALILLRPFTIGEWVVAIIGYVTPLYFFSGLLFLTDRLPALTRWPDLGISLPRQVPHPVFLLGCIGTILILTASGLFVLQGQMPKSVIAVRRNWGAIVAAFIVSVIVSVLTAGDNGVIWLVLMPALSMIISNPMLLEKNKRFSNFTFYFSLLFVIFCQVALHK
jgi:hypothetical protein